MANSDTTTLHRLRWKCRRGMLELDEILSRFLDQHYQELSAEEIATFSDLLEMQDPELLRVLLGYQEATQVEQVVLLKKYFKIS